MAFWNAFPASARSSARSRLPGLATIARSRRCTIRAARRGPDRLAGDEHVDRVGVQLREIAAAPPSCSWRSARENSRSCALSSAGTSLAHRHLPLTISSTLPTLAPGDLAPPSAVPSGRFGGEGHLGLHRHLAGCVQLRLLRLRLAVDAEFEGVGIAVGDVGAALGDALAPVGEIDRCRSCRAGRRRGPGRPGCR